MAKDDKIYIYGKHALTEALLANPKAVKKVYLYQELDDVKLARLISESGVSVDIKTKDKVPADMEDNSHQGVIASVSVAELMRSYEDFVEKLEVGPDTALVVLGELQDPHNVGAVIRSAAAFGIAGVLMPAHNQAPVTGAVAKVSAGMVFRIPLITIGNVNQTLADLKKRGFWTYGLAGEGAQPITEEKFDTPTVFVLGNEAKGIREKTRETCDILLSIPIDERCESLNAAAAASVTLYAWSTKHPRAINKNK